MKRFVGPILCIIFGLFFLAVWLFGTEDPNGKHNTFLNGLAAVTGLLATGYGVYGLVKGIRGQ